MATLGDDGDIKDIYVTFPDDYREKKLAGKKATFTLKIKDIQEKVKRVLESVYTR